MVISSTDTQSIAQKQGLSQELELERTGGDPAVSGVNEVGGPELSGPFSNSTSASPGQTQEGSRGLLTIDRSLEASQRVSQSVSSSYLEHYDNVSSCSRSGLDKRNALCKELSWLDDTCDTDGVGWFISAECENGHRFAKALVCNKEWCSICGDDDSIAHNRKFVRWLPKIMQIESMGYFVFTLPEGVRSQYRTKKALAKLGHDVQELLKRNGFQRGLRRWHWFGDKSTKYHPHLNVLVDGGYIPETKLDKIKEDYAELLGVGLADVNYHYRHSPGKMVHTLKYITRATFRDYDWDTEMALELRGFRNMVVWGRGLWDGQSKWSLSDLGGKAKAAVDGLDIDAIEALVEKSCPECGTALTWGKALPIGLLDMVEKQDLGAGYWRLPDIRPPPVYDKFRPRYPLLGYLLNMKHVHLQEAARRAERARAAEAEYQAVLWWDLLN